MQRLRGGKQPETIPLNYMSVLMTDAEVPCLR